MNELIELLNKVNDAYYDFIVGVTQYCKRKPARLETVLQYLKEHPDADSSDITEFIVDQPDYKDDISYPKVQNAG